MKHSCICFALILTVSALLLSGARNARGENNASKVETNSGESHATSDPVATPINQPTAYGTSTEGSRVTYNHNGDFKYVAPPPSAQSDLKKVGDIANLLSTIAVAVFTGMLWYVSKQQKLLAEKTEETARRSVEITKLEYLANSPYVFADDFVLKNFSTRNRLPEDAAALTFMVANFQIKNVGKGPAIITAARAKLKILPDDPANRRLLPNPSDDWGDLSDCVSIPLSARVIPAERSITASTGFAGLPSEEDYRAIKMTYDKHIVVYG